MTAQFENLIDLDRLELFLQLLDAGGGGSSDTVLYEAANGQNGLQIPQGQSNAETLTITDTFSPYTENYWVEAVFAVQIGNSANYMHSTKFRLPGSGDRAAKIIVNDGDSATGEIVIRTEWKTDHWEIQIYTTATFTNTPYLQRLVHVS